MKLPATSTIVKAIPHDSGVLHVAGTATYIDDIREPQGPTSALSAGSYGHGGAFGTQGWIDPQQEMIYVLLVARQNFGGGDGSDIRAEFQRLAAAAMRN